MITNEPTREKRILGANIKAGVIQMPGGRRWKVERGHSRLSGDPFEALWHSGPTRHEARMDASAVLPIPLVYLAKDFGWDQEFDTADEVFDFIRRELPQAMRLLAS